MAKKLTFIMMVFLLMTATSVVCMGIDDDFAAVKNISIEKTGGWVDSPVMNVVDDEVISREYSPEYVIQEYGSSLFEESNQFEGIYTKYVLIQKHNKSSNERDYELTTELKDEVELNDGDAIVIMVFVENEGTYELLTEPTEVYNILGDYILTLPYTGEDNPNRIRVVAFPKSCYQELEPGVNVEIVDKEINVCNQEKNFNFWSTLENRQTTMDTVNNRIR